jgi:hypothetical protein
VVVTRFEEATMQLDFRVSTALALGASLALAGCVGKSQRLQSAEGSAADRSLERCRRGVMPAIDGLIDDFEDGNNQVALMGERDGYWWVSKDTLGASVSEPAENFEAAEGGANGSAMAAHVVGHTVAAGDQAWGVEMGGNFLSANPGLYDASRYVGISFKAKAPGDGIKSVRFNVTDVNTHPDGGVCKDCWNHFRKDFNLTSDWKEYQVLFSELQQRDGWGSPRPESVTTSQVIAATFAVGGVDSDFDIWLDDLQFLECKK